MDKKVNKVSNKINKTNRNSIRTNKKIVLMLKFNKTILWTEKG